MGYLLEKVFLVSLSIAMVTCDTNQIDLVRESNEQRRARVTFTEAVALVAATPESPIAYAEFARRAEEVRPLLSHEIVNTIELRLAFLAMPPLRKGLELSPAQQVTALATTVWPIALGVRVREQETSSDYVERLCRDVVGLGCQNLAVESQASVISAKVFRMIKARAESAYSKCRDCQAHPSYRQALDEFRMLVLEVGTRGSRARSEAERNTSGKVSERDYLKTPPSDNRR